MEDLEATQHTVQPTLVEHLLGPINNLVRTIKVKFKSSRVTS